MKTQRETLLELLRQNGSQGVNSYDADYVFHIKQAPTRIHELKKAGYLIVAKTNKNRSVNWILLGKSSDVYSKTPEPVEAIFDESKIVWGADGVARLREEPKQEAFI